MTRPPHAPRAAGRAIPHIHAQKRCAWAGPSEARAGYAALDFLRGESSCAGFVGVLTPSPFLRSFAEEVEAPWLSALIACVPIGRGGADEPGISQPASRA